MLKLLTQLVFTAVSADAAHPGLYLSPQRISDLRNEIQGVRAGGRKFVRHVILSKPSAVLVLDDIETDRAGTGGVKRGQPLQ